MEKKRQLELYLHIPFCERKCSYCDFLSAPADEMTKKKYILALKQEIFLQSEQFQTYSVPSIFIGGGTPSVFEGSVIAELLESLYRFFSVEKEAEITIECNPGTLNREKAANYKQAGINRISLGLQSARNEELCRLGRIHTFEQFLESYDMVRKAGFDNVNVDLMSGLPLQQCSDWEYSLKKVVSLRPEHISAYSLMIEPGTPYEDRYGEDERRREAGEEPLYLPDEDTERQMYRYTEQYLADYGYRHYEISNYARAGRECRHNIGYWKRKNYLGLGIGSASLIENVRFQNTSELEAYCRGSQKKEQVQTLTRKEQMEEFLFLGLRMMEGVSGKEFLDCFGVPLEGVYGREIHHLCQQGLLQRKGGYVALTEEGIAVSNYVMAEFL